MPSFSIQNKRKKRSSINFFIRIDYSEASPVRLNGWIIYVDRKIRMRLPGVKRRRIPVKHTRSLALRQKVTDITRNNNLISLWFAVFLFCLARLFFPGRLHWALLLSRHEPFKIKFLINIRKRFIMQTENLYKG